MIENKNKRYATPVGGLPAQTDLMSPTDRAVVTNAYTFIPGGVHRDIVTMRLPHWSNTRLWVLAKPNAGFATTFSHYLMEVSSGGGSVRPEVDVGAESGLFITSGSLELTINDSPHILQAGGFAFLPPGCQWTCKQNNETPCHFHWIRKSYVAIDGIDIPEPFVVNERDIKPIAMPDTDSQWTTTRFFDMDDVRYDMHITIVTLGPGAVIPFLETHVMEHGLYVLNGKGVYRLNQDWVEVEAGDYMWLRAFCPQACYAGGPEPFRYLLYKDMHRHCPLQV